MTGFPGIYEKRTKSGVRYQVKWRRLDGTQASKTFRTKTEAKSHKAKMDTARRGGEMLDDRLAKVTFSEYAQIWVATKGAHRSTTVARRDGILRKHLLPTLGAMRLTAIRHADIRRLVGEWEQAGLSAFSIRNHIRVLNPILELAVRDEIIAKNPAKGVDLPRLDPPDPRFLTSRECTDLLAAVDDAYEPLVYVTLATGLRWSEVAALEVGDLNLLKKELTVRESKTKAGRRVLYIDPVSVGMIAAHLKATGRTGGSPDSPLFTSPNGLRLNYRNFIERVFKPACAAAHIEDVTFHALRRTHATALMDAGANPKVVQHRMGHKSITTTLTYYAGTTEHARKDASAAFGEYLKRDDPGARAEQAR
jgi:integrase